MQENVVLLNEIGSKIVVGTGRDWYEWRSRFSDYWSQTSEGQVLERRVILSILLYHPSLLQSAETNSVPPLVLLIKALISDWLRLEIWKYKSVRSHNIAISSIYCIFKIFPRSNISNIIKGIGFSLLFPCQSNFEFDD